MSAKFQLVEDPVEISAPAPSSAPKTSAIDWGALQLLGVALTALSQRAMVALASCFSLLTVASAFYLWVSIPQPNQQQLISLSIYAVFILIVNWLVRKK